MFKINDKHQIFVTDVVLVFLLLTLNGVRKKSPPPPKKAPREGSGVGLGLGKGRVRFRAWGAFFRGDFFLEPL